MNNSFLLVCSNQSYEISLFIKKTFKFYEDKKQYSLLEVDAYDIDTINEIHLFLNSTPINGQYKLLICKNFNQCSIVLQNKLLKDIEESYLDNYAYFITNNESKIINTLISRLNVVNIIEEKIALNLNAEDEDFINNFNFTLDQLIYIRDNNEILPILKFVLTEESYDKIFIKYITELWNDSIIDIVISVLYKKVYNNNEFDKIIIISDFEKISTFNVNNKLQFEALLIKLGEEK